MRIHPLKIPLETISIKQYLDDSINNKQNVTVYFRLAAIARPCPGQVKSTYGEYRFKNGTPPPGDN